MQEFHCTTRYSLLLSDQLVHCPWLGRQLAHKQLVWFKKEPGFHWLNVAPGGQRLPLAALATGVAQWFTDNSPLPEEWGGRGLQELVS